MTKLNRAKDTTDEVKRRSIVAEVKKKVCGNKRDRTVCCPLKISAFDKKDSSEEEDKFVDSLVTPVPIGSFRNIFHDIGGQAFALDSNTVLIKGFTYDGEGPDTFFLAGTSGSPSNRGDVVLPWPSDGKKYTYRDRDIPLIKRSFDGEEDIELTLPQGKTVDQLKWISVWCRDFNVDFGHVTFPKDFEL